MLEGKGELLQYYELDEDDRSRISADFFSALKRSPASDHYELFSEVLSAWGVMCPHPQDKRLYVGKERLILHTDKHKWFYCECCQTGVINREYKPRIQKVKRSSRM